MTRTFLAVVVTTLMAGVGLTGCASEPAQMYGFTLTSAEVNGPGTLGIRAADQDVKGLVVYFHGSDQKANVIKDDRKHTDFFDPMLRAGYAVVAADARGNAFGNPASREDYRRLIAAARTQYPNVPMFFVAESMGALAALALISEDTSRQVQGMVGISPLTGIPMEARKVSYIMGPWGNRITDQADPLSWPPEAFAGRTFRLYSAKDDTVIPAFASAQAFADRFGSVATIKVITCNGQHVSADCYEGGDVEKWMARLA